MAPSDLARANAGFAFDLYGRVTGRGENLVLSPISISAALAMTASGAAGTTLEEMARVLRLPLDSERAAEVHAGFCELGREAHARADTSSWELHIANRLWGRTGHAWREAFLRITREEYGAELRELDFTGAPEESRGVINRWIEEQTAGRITDLLQPGAVTPDTRLVLTNAVYFLSVWASPFDTSRTQTASFTTETGGEVQVPMMEQERSFPFARVDDLVAVELPYAGDALSMLVLLPDGALAELEERLTPELLDSVLEELRDVRVRVRLPRFQITAEFTLNNPLAELGLVSAFNPEAADFSAMDGTRDLFITGVVHKAFIDVNEAGTEAAAATGVIVSATSMPPMFNADRPFLFAIRDRASGTLLFLGRVADPSS